MCLLVSFFFVVVFSFLVQVFIVNLFYYLCVCSAEQGAVSSSSAVISHSS